MPAKKLPVKDVLAAIDMDAKSVYKELDDDEKKGISFWLLNRYASSVSGSREKQELAVLKTNEYYNKNYTVVSRHPELQWQLLCLSAKSGKIEYHKWLGLKSNVTNKHSKNLKILEKLYPDKKIDDLNTLLSILTEKELQTILEDHAVDVNA